MQTFEELFIGGRWVSPIDGTTLEVRSPHDNSLTGTCIQAGVQDVERAIAAARDAFDRGPWPRMAFQERLDVIKRFCSIHAGRAEEFATLITSENGSPIWFTRAIQQGIAPMVEAILNAAATCEWEDLKESSFGRRTMWRREPSGVVAAIVPWNAPHQSALVKMLPALLAGCSVILKIAPETALNGQFLGEIFREAGVPDGTISVVAASRDVSEHLVKHAGIDKIAFTGSTAAGRRVASLAGETLKRVSLELGGKSAAILLPDTDIKAVVEYLRVATFANSGQTCVAQTRILVPREMCKDFADALIGGVEQLEIGDPSQEKNFFGPLVAERQRKMVSDYIKLGVEEGAVLATGGSGRPSGLDGCYVKPTIFVNANNTMRIAREEIFGPVACVIPYDTEEEAVTIANDSPYGLGGSVWTENLDKGLTVAKAIRTGTFSVNGNGPDFLAPFGGYKESGIGREFGAVGLSQYLEYKSIYL